MLESLKKEVCIANKELPKLGLTILTWGNVSAIDRENDIVAIKPSGVSYDNLKPEDIVLVKLTGEVIEGNLNPSTDTETHLEIYRNFKNANCVIHVHSSYMTAFAQAEKPIICSGTTHADYFNGKIPVTRKLTKKEIVEDYEKNTGKVIVETFEKNKINPAEIQACLVASHGPFVWGKNINKALENCTVLEFIASMQVKAIMLNPKLKQIQKDLLDKHYLRKHGANSYYGQK
jgi:L-ribulose-5-phosphate 4-epimerase